METCDSIFTRRSIRKFTAEAIAEADLQYMFEAAMAAPSAGNAQPWVFIRIDDKALLEKIPAINPYANMAPRAPLAILICGDPNVEKYPGFWPQDCAAAAQNMMLAARSRELGSVWTGVHPIAEREQGFRELLGLPAHIVPFALIIAGHPAQGFGREKRFDASKIHCNHW